MLPAEAARLENIIGRRLTFIQVCRVESRESGRTSWCVGSGLDLVNVAVDVATLQHQRGFFLGFAHAAAGVWLRRVGNESLRVRRVALRKVRVDNGGLSLQAAGGVGHDG